MKRALLLAALAVVLPAIVYAQTTGDQFVDTGVPDIIPRDDSVGPVANTGAEFKFDDGFYQKIQNLIDAEPRAGDPGVFDGVRYYDVILVVGRDDGDDRDPDEVSKENKAALVKRLELLGARDIVAAGALSFVTASIPVAEVPGFSLHEEVFKLGDGELPVIPDVDVARVTMSDTVTVFASKGGLDNPTGVTVGPVYTSTEAESANAPTADLPNNSPELVVSRGGVTVLGVISPPSLPVTLDIQYSDAEGDPVSVGVLAGDLPGQSISIADHGDGTATVTIGQGAEAGAYMFWIEATDPFNHVLEPFVVQIP